MRVAIDGSGMAPGTSAGIEKFTYRLVESLCEAGPDDEFELLIPSGTREQWQRQVASAPNLRVHEVTTPASMRAAARSAGSASVRSRAVDGLRRNSLARRVGYRWKQRQRSRAFAALKPDVVYLPTDVGGCPDAKSVDGAPAVVTMHDLRVLSPTLGDPLFAKAHAQCVERAAAVVTSWDEPRAEIVARYPELAQRLFMVSFPSLLPASDGPVEQRDQPFLLYPASTLPHKNHVRLLQAFADVRKRHDIRLICTGPPIEPGASEVRRQIRALALDQRVEMLGFVTDDELAALFRGCAGVVVPTLWEAASGAVMEAIEFGRPLCCSNIDSVRRQIADTRARAALFDPTDVAEMSRAITAIIEEPDRYTGTEPFVDGEAHGRLPAWPEVGLAYLQVMRWAVDGADPTTRPFDRIGFGSPSR